MKPTEWLAPVACLVALALLSSPTSHAEVSVDSPGPSTRASLVQLLPTEDGSGPHPWSRQRLHVPDAWILNPGGDDNGDGPPATAVTPGTGAPQVCWARFDGNDHEIVISRWDGSAWTSPRPITDDDEEDLDPDLVVDESGTRHVTWWKPGDTRVRYASVSDTEGSPRVEIVTEPPAQGTRPSIALFAGSAWVAWQVDVADHVDVRVSRRRAADDWSPATTVGSATWAGPAGDGALDVQVHSLGGHLWIDWVDDPGVLAFSEYDPGTGTWSAEEHQAYDWNESEGIDEPTAREMARVTIRRRILGP